MKFTDIVRDRYRGPAYGQEFTTWFAKVRHNPGRLTAFKKNVDANSQKESSPAPNRATTSSRLLVEYCEPCHSDMISAVRLPKLSW